MSTSEWYVGVDRPVGLPAARPIAFRVLASDAALCGIITTSESTLPPFNVSFNVYPES